MSRLTKSVASREVKTIEPENFAGFVELYFNGLSSGWTAIEDEYGTRLIPMILEEVWEWLEKATVGTYVLEEFNRDGVHEDRVYFSETNDLLMFKLRWIG